MKLFPIFWSQIIIVYSVVHSEESAAASEKYAFCGDCWCIPDDDDGGGVCPYDNMPPTEFSDTLLENLRGMTHENPLELNCNPYHRRSGCDTVPALVTGGVCAASIKSNNVQCPQDFSYTLQTFASAEDAESNGFFVTHEGACGTCSSFQDLAVYMAKPSLTDAGIQCTFRATLNFKDGLRCYEELGFSPGCAAIWLYNSKHTRNVCLSHCAAHAVSGLPSNLPAPGCELADCIQCDEDESGPLFQQFGGRTRRKSCLLSTIARSCSSIPSIVHKDPCLVAGRKQRRKGGGLVRRRMHSPFLDSPNESPRENVLDDDKDRPR